MQLPKDPLKKRFYTLISMDIMIINNSLEPISSKQMVTDLLDIGQITDTPIPHMIADKKGILEKKKSK